MQQKQLNVVFSFQITYSRILEVQNLKPFSAYIFHVSLKNYYSDLEGIIPLIGPPAKFQTAAGGKLIYLCLFFMWRNSPTRVLATSLLRALDHTQLDTCTQYETCETVNQLITEIAAYTTHNQHKK